MCGSPGTNKSTCPMNEAAVSSGRVKPEKHPAASGIASAGAGGRRRSLSPPRPVYRADGALDPMHAVVDTRKYGKDERLKAGEYFRSGGRIGDRCQVRKSHPENIGCLLKRKNNAAYWAYPSKSGAGQEACEDWSLRCDHSW